MLALARDLLADASAEEAGRVTLVHADLADLAPPERGYDAVVSNSLLHHLHRPEGLWRAVRQQGRSGAAVYITDLMRPDSPEAARAIVDTYAAEEPEQLRTDFYNSLFAAFTPEEVAGQLREAGLAELEVAAVSDRHLRVRGRLPD
jgi:SAM-dependent methyltransferase